jgi:hypothetical protein
MALSHPTPVRTTLANVIKTAIDVGTGPGVLELKNSGGAVLATIILNKPCGTVTNGVLTYNVSPLPRDPLGDANGTAALFSIKDSNNTEVYSGTVTATGGGGDVEMISTSVIQNLPVEISDMSYGASA